MTFFTVIDNNPLQRDCKKKFIKQIRGLTSGFGDESHLNVIRY